MRNSEYHFRDAMISRAFKLSALGVVMLLFLIPALYLVSSAKEEVPYTIFSVSALVLTIAVFVDDKDTASTNYNLKRAKLEYQKEELLNNFNSSANYAKYLEQKIDNPEVILTTMFLATMNEVVTKLNKIDNLSKDGESLRDLAAHQALIEESRELATHILINPNLLKENAHLVDYVRATEELATKHHNKRYPATGKSSGESPEEIIAKINGREINGLFDVKDVDYEDMEEFLIDFNYVVNSKQVLKNNTGPGTKKPLLHMTLREIMNKIKGENI